MDNKNVFIAIALSMSVLLFWAAFFETPRPAKNVPAQQQKNENIITPNINELPKIKIVSRDDALKKSKRVKIENDSIIGSLSLEGGMIDDISFKKHKQNLENNENVKFLNPADTENGFYVETGWTSINNKIKVPTKKTIWTLEKNTNLSQNQPITLKWNNGEGITFKK